jgi:tRNA (guanine-N7-)-methyltransferase
MATAPAKPERTTERPSNEEERFLFGRRKAKPLSTRQLALFQSLLPALSLDPDRDPVEDPVSLFGHRPNAIFMEIGFGGGEHLVSQAAASPQAGFIGIEPFVNGIAKALVQIDARKISNIRIFDNDAALLIGRLPDGSLTGVDLLYPDPWPKRRHWKRRFVNEKNLQQIIRILAPGGQFRFVSDHPGYVIWALRHCSLQPGLSWTARSAGDWLRPWPGWHSTRYEKKAVRDGRQPAYLVFEKQPAAA